MKSFKIGSSMPRPDTMRTALKESLKKPYIGVTQGGSSRKNSGARVAATSTDTPSKKDRSQHG